MFEFHRQLALLICLFANELSVDLLLVQIEYSNFKAYDWCAWPSSECDLFGVSKGDPIY